MENLEEMDEFLDRYKNLKLNQDQVNYLYNPITPKEIKEVINNLPSKTSSGPGRFSAEFYCNLMWT